MHMEIFKNMIFFYVLKHPKHIGMENWGKNFVTRAKLAYMRKQTIKRNKNTIASIKEDSFKYSAAIYNPTTASKYLARTRYAANKRAKYSRATQ